MKGRMRWSLILGIKQRREKRERPLYPILTKRRGMKTERESVCGLPSDRKLLPEKEREKKGRRRLATGLVWKTGKKGG